jgi:phosphoribosylglycinamide formyltransferase 1
MPDSGRDPRRVAVLISGRGSNMRALVEQARGYEVVLVASNNPLAPGHDWARDKAIPTWAWDSRGKDRSRWESALDQALEDHRVGTIALAGFMRILSPGFTHRWAGRIVNIHPSLLPRYKGLDTHRRAIEAGDEVSGCSVHLVTEELDAGDVIAQAEVPVLSGDTEASLEARVLEAEHKLYPQALARFVARS